MVSVRRGIEIRIMAPVRSDEEKGAFICRVGRVCQEVGVSIIYKHAQGGE